MIASALKLLRDELSNYILLNKRVEDPLTAADVKLENIAALESGNSNDLENSLIVTLVNTEEESSLKNSSHYYRSSTGVAYVEPPVFLNLYVLVTATLDPNLQDAYEFALHRLGLVIQFFQSKRKFSIKNSPFTSIANDDSITQGEKDELRLLVELYTLTFEQINHLWGSLGGKQVPFVMYKLRLVKIQNRDVGQETPVIEEVAGSPSPSLGNSPDDH